MGGRSENLVGGGDDVVGDVDQSMPGWLQQRDQLIGRDVMGRGPGDAFVACLALLDRDFGFPWALIPMIRAGAVRPEWSAAVSRST